MCRRSYNKIEKLTIQIVKLQNPHRCAYCGRELKRDEITVDHVIPYSKGGKTDFTNLVIACKHCNQKKSNMTLNQYMIFIKN
ncbi:HNH endonuclease [Clostridium botulinum]|uniref:HNH endonuclease n=1 Tax=Clostridium botulinum TaxID=1491 RepID=UPI001E500A5B|nr:HNH endonuclease [Clostridium botulinum]MCD3254360.1 HNH endonuclease [Clostridium botulinum C/D]MCD3279860.1 HNH endonuclease [Clostridium botulinum C/D]MCD3339591.1 HNH endonuclease [Clostridium botulinum C/D]MCD3357499.1 HNH endonuclease [Clostridium botulinum C/D]